MDEKAKALSRLYDEVWAQVKTIVDHADPEGLLALGCPEDEYDDAVGQHCPQSPSRHYLLRPTWG